MTQPKLAALFHDHPALPPSAHVPLAEAMATGQEVIAALRARGVEGFGIRIHGTHEYPARLRDAAHPIEVALLPGHLGAGRNTVRRRARNAQSEPANATTPASWSARSLLTATRSSLASPRASIPSPTPPRSRRVETQA